MPQLVLAAGDVDVGLGGADTTSVSRGALPSALTTSCAFGSGDNAGGEARDVVASTEVDDCDFAGEVCDIVGGEVADNAGGESGNVAGGELAGAGFSCTADTGSGTAAESGMSCCSIPENLSNSFAILITDCFFISDVRFKRTFSFLSRIVFPFSCVAFK